MSNSIIGFYVLAMETSQRKIYRLVKLDFKADCTGACLLGLLDCTVSFKFAPWRCCEKYPLLESYRKPKQSILVKRSLSIDTTLKS